MNLEEKKLKIVQSVLDNREKLSKKAGLQQRSNGGLLASFPAILEAIRGGYDKSKGVISNVFHQLQQNAPAVTQRVEGRLSQLLQDPTIRAALLGASVGGLSSFIASPENKLRNLLFGAGLGGLAGGGLGLGLHFLKTPVLSTLPPEAREAVKNAPKPFADNFFNRFNFLWTGLPAAIIGTGPLSSFVSALNKIRAGSFSSNPEALNEISEKLLNLISKGNSSNNELILKALTTPSSLGVNELKETFVIPSYKRQMAEYLRGLPYWKQLYNALRVAFGHNPTSDVIAKARESIPGGLNDIIKALAQGKEEIKPYAANIADEAVLRKAVPEFARFLSETSPRIRGLTGAGLATAAMLLNAYLKSRRSPYQS